MYPVKSVINLRGPSIWTVRQMRSQTDEQNRSARSRSRRRNLKYLDDSVAHCISREVGDGM